MVIFVIFDWELMFLGTYFVLFIAWVEDLSLLTLPVFMSASPWTYIGKLTVFVCLEMQSLFGVPGKLTGTTDIINIDIKSIDAYEFLGEVSFCAEVETG